MRRALGLYTLAAWAWGVFVALADRRSAPRLGDAGDSAGDAFVSVIVPARNEEGRIAPALRSLGAQDHERLEVIVVDDESEDGTLAEALAAAGPRVRVIEGAPRPDGWVGKSWAAEQGVREARGDWLLFTDADVIHAPTSAGSAVALAERLGAAGVTVLCRLEAGTAAERIVQPAAAVLIRTFVAPGPLVRSRRSPIAIAAGGFILVRRDVYEQVGGHGSVRDELIDDMALAVRLKEAGEPLVIADGTDRVRVRMYHGLGELWRGWRKNSSVGISRSPALAGAGAASALVLAFAPAWLTLRGPRALGLAALTLQLASRAAVDGLAPTPRRYWLTLPTGMAFLAAVSLRSTLDRLNGGVEWRGRRYSI